MRRRLLLLLVALASLTSPASALAQPDAAFMAKRDASERRPDLALRVGLGLTQFSSNQVSGFTGIGPLWEARGTWRREQLVGAELAYFGSVNGVDAPDFGYSATLLGNGVEAALRLNPPAPGRFHPYVMVGVAALYYRMLDESADLPFIKDSDVVMQVPVSLGLEIDVGRLLFDLRGSLRPSFDGEIIELPSGQMNGSTGVEAGIDTWAVTAAVGFRL